MTQRIEVRIQKADLGFEHQACWNKNVILTCVEGAIRSKQMQKYSKEFHSSSKWKSRKQGNFSQHSTQIILFLLLTQPIFLKESKIFCDLICDNNYGNKLEIWGFGFFLSSLVKVQQRSEKFDTKPDLLLCKNAFMTKDCVFFWRQTHSSKNHLTQFARALPRVFVRLKRCFLTEKCCVFHKQWQKAWFSRKFRFNKFEYLNILFFLWR